MLTCEDLAEKIYDFIVRESHDGWKIDIISIHVTVEDRYALLSDHKAPYYFQYLWNTPDVEFINHRFIYEPHAEKSYILFETTRVSQHDFNQPTDIKEMTKWGKHKTNLEDL